LIGFLAFGFSLRWLLSGVEILDGVSAIKDDYEKTKTKLDGESITGLIVKMMAYYRNKSTIRKLSWLSRIVGVYFIVSGNECSK